MSPTRASLVLALGVGLAACAGTRTTGPLAGPLPGLGGDGSGSVVPIPNAPAGDAARRGAAGPSARRTRTPLTTEQARALATSRLTTAQSLWQRAVELEPRSPGAAADLFSKIVDDYPEYERAAEARFREGRARFEAGDYDDAATALETYMRLAPVNPHLAEVEEMIFESGRRLLASSKGLFGLFGKQSQGLDALKFVPQTFPAGKYSDDALLALGDYYREDEDYINAALQYKELLIRYPDSEWSFQARLRLGDTYLARDQGQSYEAGFVDVDPREAPTAEEAKLSGPVKGAVELALEQYDAYLERMAADPARRAEYAKDVAYARRQQQICRERLASKDLFRGDWYAGRGDRLGAVSLWREAARWTTTQAGRTAAARLAAAGRASPAAPPATSAPPALPPPTRPAATRPPAALPSRSPGDLPSHALPVPPPPPPPPLPPPPRESGA